MVDPPSSRLTMLSSLRCMYLGWCKGTVSRLSTSGIHVLNTSVPMPASLMTNIYCRTVLMKVSLLCVLLYLLWSLVEVYSQTAPYLTFNDSVIPNHAYVDLNLMMYPGNTDTTADYSSTVICHTDLTTCCRGSDGGDGGDWYFPDGGPLPGAGIHNENSHPISQRKRNQLDRLQRGPTGTISDIPDGIYRCAIETVAMNNADNTVRETVYVGAYGSGGTVCNT